MKIYVPKLTTDLKNSIKDCILAVLYRKKDVIDFFRQNSCTSSDLRHIDEALMSRSALVDQVFSNLETRSDSGTRQIHSILDQLTEWADFDSYWFYNGKLDPTLAKEKIDKLKKIVGKKTEIEEEKSKIHQKHEYEQKLKLQRDNLQQLCKRFYKMCQSLNDASQQRGYDLQDLIQCLFNHFFIETNSPFKISGEEIDGSFKFEGENYIFEAKWQDKMTSCNQLYTFAHKVEGKAMYARGVFFSINGYTDEAIEALKKGKVQKTILFDSQDFIAILEEQISLSKLLDGKIRAAQTRGNIYVSAGIILQQY